MQASACNSRCHRSRYTAFVFFFNFSTKSISETLLRPNKKNVGSLWRTKELSTNILASAAAEAAATAEAAAKRERASGSKYIPRRKRERELSQPSAEKKESCKPIQFEVEFLYFIRILLRRSSRDMLTQLLFALSSSAAAAGGGATGAAVSRGTFVQLKLAEIWMLLTTYL